MGQTNSQFKEYKREQKLRQESKKIDELAHSLSVCTAREKLAHISGWIDEEQKKQSLRMLKSMFSQLDGGVAQCKGADHGTIHMSIKHNPTQALLLVRVEKCDGLRSMEVRSPICNPYTKLWLLPDAQNEGVKSTSPVHLTCNPCFNELFSFTIQPEFLLSGKIILEVWDFDSNRQDEFLGQSLVNLKDLDFINQSTHNISRALAVKSELDVSGDLDIELSYNENEEESGLSITVHGATGLVVTDGMECWVETVIPGSPFKMTTQCKPLNEDSRWEEVFYCHLKRKDLQERFVLFDVKGHDLVSGGQRFLGQALVFLTELDSNSHLRKTVLLSDMRNSDLLQEKVSQNSTTQELREALRAHALTAQPNFIFHPLSGNKKISLTAQKAGSTAEVKLQDGIPIF